MVKLSETSELKGSRPLNAPWALRVYPVFDAKKSDVSDE